MARIKGSPKEITDALVCLDVGECYIYSKHCSPQAARQAKYVLKRIYPDIILIRMSIDEAQRAVHGS